jgi:hypothetical protein
MLPVDIGQAKAASPTLPSRPTEGRTRRENIPEDSVFAEPRRRRHLEWNALESNRRTACPKNRWEAPPARIGQAMPLGFQPARKMPTIQPKVGLSLGTRMRLD